MAQGNSITPAEDCSAVALEWLRRLEKAGETGDVEPFSQLLLTNGWVRGVWIVVNARRSESTVEESQTTRFCPFA